MIYNSYFTNSLQISVKVSGRIYASNCQMIIDTGASCIFGPTAIIGPLSASLGATYNPTTQLYQVHFRL